MENKIFERKYFIDWLRVIAIVLVLYYHSAKIFSANESWLIKNGELGILWHEFNLFLSAFRMPMLFFISGVGTFFALRKRTAWQYVKERHTRLLIPLIFGIFLIIPPQLYYQRMFNNVNYNSFIDFYKTVLEFVPYPKGNLSWHHLWFVLYLFVFSLLGVPFFMFLKSEKGKILVQKLNWLSGKWGIYLLAIPSILVYINLCFKFPRTNAFIGDWGYMSYWCSYFFAGYFIACNENFWNRIETNRKLSLKLAILGILCINYHRWSHIEPWTLASNFWYRIPYIYFYQSIDIFKNWAMLLACLGYGKKYLNRNSRILSYSNQGIYPFYIIHQTIIVILGYYIIPTKESILVKFIFISTISLFLSIAFYEFVKPYKITRFMFGIKSEKKKVIVDKKNMRIESMDKTG